MAGDSGGKRASKSARERARTGLAFPPSSPVLSVRAVAAAAALANLYLFPFGRLGRRLLSTARFLLSHPPPLHQWEEGPDVALPRYSDPPNRRRAAASERAGGSLLRTHNTANTRTACDGGPFLRTRASDHSCRLWCAVSRSSPLPLRDVTSTVFFPSRDESAPTPLRINV